MFDYWKWPDLASCFLEINSSCVPSCVITLTNHASNIKNSSKWKHWICTGEIIFVVLTRRRRLLSWDCSKIALLQVAHGSWQTPCWTLFLVLTREPTTKIALLEVAFPTLLNLSFTVYWGGAEYNFKSICILFCKIQSCVHLHLHLDF